MDLNQKIEARRVELARQAQQQKLETAAREEQQRDEALNRVVIDMNAAGVAVHRDGDEINLDSAPTPSIDVDGLQRSAIDRMVKREARRQWTPRENWIVIGSLVAGVCLTPLWGVGLILMAVGFLVRNSLNQTYRAEVRDRITVRGP